MSELKRLKNKLENFNKRWKVPSTLNPEEEFQKFKVRILEILKDIDSHLPDEGITLFCQTLGIPEDWQDDSFGDRKWTDVVYRTLRAETQEKKFYKLIELISCLPIQDIYGYRPYEITYSKSKLLRNIENAVQISNINADTKIIDKELLFFPKGEELLDEELVDSPLSFLEDKSKKHFIDGLTFYADKNWVKTGESLRRSIEEFLRTKLSNQKGLKENIIEIGKKLKTDSVSSQVRNIIIQIFSYLDQYFNENTKHNDGELNEADAEFLIYQCGLLMRYLNKI